MGKLSVPKRSRRRTGRPLKSPTPGTRMSLGLKVTAETKARLDKAARETGRTQSQEAELRLQRSFEREDLLPQVLKLAYGDKPAELLMQVGASLKMDPSCGTGAFLLAAMRFLRGTVRSSDADGHEFVFVLDGDGDEPVTRSSSTNIPFADESQPGITWHVFNAKEIADAGADGALNAFSTSRSSKPPSRDALAVAINKALVQWIANRE